MSTQQLPLHARYREFEGPIAAYKNATGDWTPQMNQNLRSAFAAAERRGPVIVRMDYRCPHCHAEVSTVETESILAYEVADFTHIREAAWVAQLISMSPCGHAFRQEFTA
ncbi:hypothetical protein [Streptomyces lydicus]|uniref:hypothetical protein n=1 Tax=Streptomyces lydicus TaxID=47763 RepID=UPI0037AC2174